MQKTSGQVKKVFVVEDDNTSLEYIKRLLNQFHYELAGTADKGSDAIEMIKDIMPDLVLLDIILNDNLTGMDVAVIISTELKIPFLFITSNVDETVIENIRSVNPYGFIEKPFSRMQFYSAIETAFNRYDLECKIIKASADTDRIFRLSLDLISIANREGYFIRVSESFTRILGYETQELLSIPFINFVHPEDVENTEMVFKDMFTSYLPLYRFRNRVLHKNGTFRWIEWSSNPIPDEKFIYSVGRDITESIIAEYKIKLNEARLSSLLELSRMSHEDTHKITDHALQTSIQLTGSKIGYFAFVNEDETVLTMYSWSSEAMKECAIKDIQREYDVSKTGLWGEAVRQRKAIITNNYSEPGPYKKGYPQGHVRLTRHMNVPIFDNLRIVLVAGVGNKETDYDESDVRQLTLLMDGLWNIIRQRKLFNDLSSSEKRLRTFIESTSEGIISFDESGRIIEWNPSAEKITGLAFDEVKGLYCWDVAKKMMPDSKMNEENFNSYENKVRKALQTGVPSTVGPRTIQLKSGDNQLKYIEQLIISIKTSIGYRFYIIINDITSRRESELEIKRLNIHIMKIQEEERQKVSRDLHDSVGQTIIAAKVNVEMFTKDQDRYKDRLDLGLNFLDKASQELREIYTNLYPSILSDLGLPATIRWYAKNVLSLQGIETKVYISVEEKINHEIEVNLYRIIQEAFSNIIRHSGAAKVQVRLEKNKNTLSLEINDNGTGISGTSDTNGKGHGLTNMAQRVNSMGGNFDIKSSPQSGTKIVINVEDKSSA